jgi:hypothetical protein
MRVDPELCGLGIQWPQIPWFDTGGDVYLGRSVPIYAFGTSAGTARVAPAINYAIGARTLVNELPGFSVVRCWTDKEAEICLLRAKPGKICFPDSDFDLNSVTNLGRPGTEHGADR